MAGSADSDDDANNSSSFRDFFPDLTNPVTSTSQSNRFNSSQPPWFSSSTTRPSSSPFTPRPSSLLPRRTSSREQTRSAPEIDLSSQSGPPQPQTIFNTPNRSIFSSGPPTSSVSVNTAQASIATPPPGISSRPLSALTSPAIGSSRRPANYSIDSHSSIRKRRFRVEKDVDDPTNSLEDATLPRRMETSTPITLSSLFAGPESASPSRNSSYLRDPSSTYTRAQASETPPLPHHLYNRGLLSGRHSDITVNAFSNKYPLHRLLLDRAPFFSSAFSEPWSESSSKEINLYPEDIDSNITQASFELALKRIYGCHVTEEEDKEPVGLFATGCWLDMADLIESSINSILRQMCPAKLATYIQFVTNNYYGKHGDRILTAAKAMLCRDGYEMLNRYWDGIAGDIVREIIGSDGFYIPGEWERWALARKILNRRLKAKATEAGILASDGTFLKPRPDSMTFMAVRFDAVYHKSSGLNAPGASDGAEDYIALYTHPDIAPLLVLLDEGIHYVHLSFEHLQAMRDQKDILGVPLMPEKVISNALWASMELRQRIVNASEHDLDLGFSQKADPAEGAVADTPPESPQDDDPDANKTGPSGKALGKKVEIEPDDDSDNMISDSWDGNGKPRKFWIPQADSTYPMGGTPEPVQTVNSQPGARQSRFSASLEPQDVQWASDFAASGQDRPDTPNAPTVGSAPSPQVTYSHYPPFRFSAEFPNARLLKEGKRVYSNTVWYAGSLWNVYIQKKETAKHTQLGIYLHRERQVEGQVELMAELLHSSVDERIGQLERELLIRRAGGRRAETRIYATDDTNSGNDTTLISGPSQDLDTLSGLLRNQGTSNLTKASEASLKASSLARGSDDDEELEEPKPQTRYKAPALPAYVDARPTIKTYFKIYTPSKAGRILSVYESAPDTFNFSQSWGWKSSNLVVDDGIIGETTDGAGKAKDLRLRFMVVIGNV